MENKNKDNQQIDIYDFDKTVVPFDSALKYWGYCMAHCPWTLVLFPLQFVWGIMMITHIISVTTCKKLCFLYINLINNKRMVKKFWDKYESEVFDWFKPQNRKRACVLASASPDFLIEEIASRLGIDYVVCTRYDKRGVMIGEVCRKDEKVRRIKAELPDVTVEDVYSDNPSHDKYIFALGKRCFLANKGVLTQFEYSSLCDKKQSEKNAEYAADELNSELQNN